MEIKDVRLPISLQRAMAAEAEASREAKAKVGVSIYRSALVLAVYACCNVLVYANVG